MEAEPRPYRLTTDCTPDGNKTPSSETFRLTEAEYERWRERETKRLAESQAHHDAIDALHDETENNHG